MKTDRQRIAIAELCGWHSFRLVDDLLWGMPATLKRTVLPTDPVPDYLNDLNAMHAAEALQLEKDGWSFQCGYTLNLRKVVIRRRKDSNAVQNDLWMLHANATQRAEAFLRATDKWMED